MKGDVSRSVRRLDRWLRMGRDPNWMPANRTEFALEAFRLLVRAVLGGIVAGTVFMALFFAIYLAVSGL